MIIQFVDAQGQPVVDATVGVAASPQSFPDLGMLTDKAGEIDIEIPVAGRYGFVVHVDGQSYHITSRLSPSDRRVCLKLG